MQQPGDFLEPELAAICDELSQIQAAESRKGICPHCKSIGVRVVLDGGNRVWRHCSPCRRYTFSRWG